MLIKNCFLKYQDRSEGLKDIQIKKGKIVYIGENLETSGRLIDAGGRIVTPGFVEPHCHMGVYETAVPEGMDGNESTNPITIGLRGVDAIDPYDTAFEVALRNGVTTLVCGPGSANIMGGSFTAVKSFGDTFQSRIITREIALKMALGENPKFNYGKRGEAPATRMKSAALMREYLFKAKEYREKYRRHKEDEDSEHFNYDMHLHSLMRAFDGMLVKIHAHQADDIMTAIRIAEEFDLNYTIEHCTEGHLIIDYLKEHKVRAILGPVLGGKSKFEVRNKSFENGRIFEESGLLFAIMTDHPVVPEESQRMQLSQMIKHGLSRQAAFDAVTKNAAKIVGLDKRVGEIAKGKDADIVIWDADPFDTYSHADVVLVDGRIAHVRRGEVEDVDYKFD